jgi:hypothetical protein
MPCVYDADDIATGTCAISTTLDESAQAFMPHPLPPANRAPVPVAFADLNH